MMAPFIGYKTAVLLFLVVICSCSSTSPRGLPPLLDITRLKAPGPGKCQDDLLALKRGLDSDQLWALTMLDATVKAPVGLLSQTAVQFGDFDSCLSVSEPILSQHCLVDIYPGNVNRSLWSHFRWALCVPASCSTRELESSLQTYMNSEAPGLTVKVGPQACTTKETTTHSFTWPDIIYCAVIIGIFGLVGAATISDFVTRPNYDGVSPPKSIAQCLSMRQGWYSLFRTEQPVTGLNTSVLYGLHACFFFLLVLGHRFLIQFMFMTMTNYRSVEYVFTESWFSILACHTDLFVDIFYFLSSFLLGLIYSSELDKHFVNPLMVYTLRYFRTIPVYSLMVFLYATLLRHLGDGPMWNSIMEEEQGYCKEQWWTNFLFINTYINSDKICIVQSSYMSCDFQLFVLGTLLVLLLHRNFKFGIVVVGLVFVASALAAFFTTYLYNGPAILMYTKEYVTDIRHNVFGNSLHTQSIYRGTTYLPGLLTGIYVYKHRDQHLTKGMSCALGCLGFAIALAVWCSGVLFYSKTLHPGPLTSALYAASFHTVFGIGVALIFTSLLLSEPSFIFKLFSWKGFVPISKLSYCALLIHLVLQIVWAASLRAPVYMCTFELISWTIADVVISLWISLILHLTVETPVRYLIKYFITGSPKKSLASNKGREIENSKEQTKKKL